jgi:biuret amidohydrolase
VTDVQASKQADRLRRLVEPAHTAVVTMELQRGIVGEDALLPALVEEVRRAGILATAGRICTAAREVGVRVVHCTAEVRHDAAGAAENCKIFALGAKRRRDTGTDPTMIGTNGVRLVPELGEDPRDIVMPRLHGMTPFTGTSVDQVLRNLGIRTIVAMGVSVNLGVFGMSLTALDLGYQVVVVRDAVAGVPAAYATSVLDNSISLIATVVTADELLAAWDLVAS